MATSGTAKAQGALWNLAANDWACLLEWHMAPAWEMALTLAGVGRGTRFLDGGCGSGGACKIAARLGAHVTGLDAAPALLAIARDRVPDGKFEAGELQDLPFADGTFDAVLTANSLQYTADPAATLAGIRRVLSPLGTYVVVQWGRAEKCDMERSLFPAVRAVAPPPPGTPAPLALSDIAVMNRMLDAAGFSIIADQMVPIPFEFPSMADAWRAQRSAGPLQKAIQIAGEEAIRKAVEEAMQSYQRPSGMIRLNNEFRVVVSVPK